MSKKTILILFFCLLFFYLNMFSLITYAEISSEPKVKAQGSILMDKKTGRILWEHNSQQPMAMASTTKIMTAIIALENGKIDEEVTVSKNAVLAPPVKMYLKKDEKISLENLLYALMLQSSNDAAVAIAEHIGEDVEGFCRLMNQKAKTLGCKDTIFETPNGLDKGNHHSTAEDMAIIARYALDNEKFLKIINTKSISFKTNFKTYDIINKNRLLNEYNGAEGIKTGFTGKAGHCFVGAAKRDDLELISVVLASGWGSSGKNQKWIDTKNILDYGFKNYKYENVLNKNAIVGRTRVLKARKESIELCLAEDLILPLKESEKNNLKINYSFPKEINAPIKKGQAVGKAEVFISDKEKYEIAIVSMDNAELHSFQNSIGKIIFAWFKIAL